MVPASLHECEDVVVNTVGCTVGLVQGLERVAYAILTDSGEVATPALGGRTDPKAITKLSDERTPRVLLAAMDDEAAPSEQWGCLSLFATYYTPPWIIPPGQHILPSCYYPAE